MIDRRLAGFACSRCGRCCLAPGWVQFTPADQRRAARALGVAVARFRETYGHEEDGSWIRVTRARRCPFLTDHGCSIYAARPEQCRTFPYWPEHLADTGAWNRAARRCPGMKKIV